MDKFAEITLKKLDEIQACVEKNNAKHDSRIQKLEKAVGQLQNIVLKHYSATGSDEQNISPLSFSTSVSRKDEYSGNPSQTVCTDGLLFSEKKCSVNNTPGECTPSGCDDNFYNNMKEQVHQMFASGSERLDKSGSKTNIRKSASFNEESLSPRLRMRRTPSGSFPFSKGEKEKHEKFKTECLSKAIQWNSTDIMESFSPRKPLSLPTWVTKQEHKWIKKRGHKSDDIRKFLCLLQKQNFERMHSWIKQNLDADLTKAIFTTFEEFSDYELNKSKLRCFRCRLINTVCVLQVADYLKAADVMSEDLYFKLIDTKQTVGGQEELWSELFKECIQNDYVAKVAYCAFKVALTELVGKVTDYEKSEIECLLIEMDKHQGDIGDFLCCHCSELCSKSLHPVSCLKMLSLAGLYMAPSSEVNQSYSFAGKTDQSEITNNKPFVYEQKVDQSTTAYMSCGSLALETDQSSSSCSPASSFSSQCQLGNEEQVAEELSSDDQNTYRKESVLNTSQGYLERHQKIDCLAELARNDERRKKRSSRVTKTKSGYTITNMGESYQQALSNKTQCHIQNTHETCCVHSKAVQNKVMTIHNPRNVYLSSSVVRKSDRNYNYKSSKAAEGSSCSSTE